VASNSGIALARALAFDPTLLLLDEPLGALDRELRLRMAGELRRIHSELKATMLYVTHDREEALTLSDRVAILREGELEAIDTPYNLYRRPESSFVASFFAGHNLLHARVIELQTENTVVAACLGQLFVVTATSGVAAGSPTYLAVPPRAIKIAKVGESTAIPGLVSDVVFLGDFVRLVCTVAGEARPVEALLQVGVDSEFSSGTSVGLIIDPSQIVAVRMV
jgi:putative spermidine/putrescine transport system ATP-binding protein